MSRQEISHRLSFTLRGSVLLVALCAIAPAASGQQVDEREMTERVADILAALALKPGTRVADIGTGDGFYTLKIAGLIETVTSDARCRA